MTATCIARTTPPALGSVPRQVTMFFVGGGVPLFVVCKTKKKHIIRRAYQVYEECMAGKIRPPIDTITNLVYNAKLLTTLHHHKTLNYFLRPRTTIYAKTISVIFLSENVGSVRILGLIPKHFLRLRTDKSDKSRKQQCGKLRNISRVLYHYCHHEYHHLHQHHHHNPNHQSGRQLPLTIFINIRITSATNLTTNTTSHDGNINSRHGTTVG